MTSQPIEYKNLGGKYTAGNTAVALVPSIADLANPKLTEVAAGTVFQCMTEGWGAVSDAKYVSEKMVCDTVARQAIASVDRKMEDLELLVNDPQTSDTFLSKFVEGSTQYLVERFGMPHASAWATGQTVNVYKLQIATTDYKPITTADGEKYRMVIKSAYQDRRLNVKLT